MARVTKPTNDDDVVVVDNTTDPAYVEPVTAADTRVVDRDVVEPAVVEPAVAEPAVVEREVVDTDDVYDRERAEFGGMKFGSAFFGWLTALGMGVLLTAIVAAIGTALGMSADDAQVSARALGVGGAIAVAVVLFIAYLAGGYVAGRMARFSGARQGFAVWLWAVIAAVVLGVLGLVLGARFDVMSNLDAFPRIPLFGDDVTAAGIITAVIFAAIALVGAILGGLAGMRYHRRVDRAGAAVV
ncbi:MAG: hypothetical protein ABI566_00455 [Pseudolysinimonas sp.]